MKSGPSNLFVVGMRWDCFVVPPKVELLAMTAYNIMLSWQHPSRACWKNPASGRDKFPPPMGNNGLSFLGHGSSWRDSPWRAFSSANRVFQQSLKLAFCFCVPILHLRMGCFLKASSINFSQAKASGSSNFLLISWITTFFSFSNSIESTTELSRASGWSSNPFWTNLWGSTV